MRKIRLLDKSVAELIAAGEVIERPASIIKELIENSVDANATVITVEIRNGGISFIRITDNGYGIPMLDMPLSFERHATSKIQNGSDLEKIMTLGFRGEALASVAAISKVEMTSKTVDEQYGGKFTIEGSQPLELEEVGCADGTSIVIRDIFFNTPARLKFLKSSTTEGNYIANLIDKIALSHPEVSFRFIRNGKQELCTTGNGDLYSAIFSVYGSEFAKSLMPVDYSINGIDIKGFVNIPHMSKNNRTMQSWFVNGRYVLSNIMTVSLEEAFKNTIMVGKFPACVLMIKIEPGLLDVNVHPTKTEIKFSNDKAVYEAIYFAVKNAIMNYSAKDTIKENKPEVITNEPRVPDSKPQTVRVFEPQTQQIIFEQPVAEYKTNNDTLKMQSSIPYTHEPTAVINENKESLNESFNFITDKAFEAPSVEKVENIQMEGIEKITENYRVVGEIFRTYIIVETENDIAVIDKHAVHERYIFEQIKEGKMHGNGQTLLFSLNVALSREEKEALDCNYEIVNKLGFSYDSLSDTEIALKEIPSVIDAEKSNEVITEIADNILANKSDISPTVLDTIYATISCKAAIKAHDINNEAELKRVVEMVFSDENLRYCPHGRPTLARYTKRQFEKLFGRTGS